MDQQHATDFYNAVCSKLQAKNIKYNKNIIEYVSKHHHCIKDRKNRKELMYELSKYLHKKTINKILQLIRALETNGDTYPDCKDYIIAMREAELELSQ